MSLQTRISDLATAVATDYKQVRTWITGSSSGTFSLNTVAQSIVGALNELEARETGTTPPAASESEMGLVELASLAEMATGTSPTLVATVAGVRQERTALKDEILGGAGAAYDTLSELSALIAAAEETSVIDALTTVVGQKANSADVYDKTAIGNPETDFAAVYAAAKA